MVTPDLGLTIAGEQHPAPCIPSSAPASSGRSGMVLPIINFQDDHKGEWVKGNENS